MRAAGLSYDGLLEHAVSEVLRELQQALDVERQQVDP